MPSCVPPGRATSWRGPSCTASLSLPKLDIAAAVSAALADEGGRSAESGEEKGPWRMVGRLAVAASVTLAVLAGVRLYNQNDALPQMAQQGTTP